MTTTKAGVRKRQKRKNECRRLDCRMDRDGYRGNLIQCSNIIQRISDWERGQKLGQISLIPPEHDRLCDRCGRPPA